jgi:hypothetical protein
VKDSENSPLYNTEIGRETSLFSFEREDILKGIIYAEVLGKPKSRKAGR